MDTHVGIEGRHLIVLPFKPASTLRQSLNAIRNLKGSAHSFNLEMRSSVLEISSKLEAADANSS